MNEINDWTCKHQSLSTQLGAHNNVTATKRMATEFGNLLKELSIQILTELASSVKIKTSSKPKKDDVVESLIDYAFDKGVQDFIKMLEKDLLKQSVEEAGMKTSKNNKKDLIELFIKGVNEHGLEEFLQKMQLDTLKKFIEILQFETDAKTKQQIAEDIGDEVLLIGARVLLDKLPAPKIKAFCKQLKLKVSGTKEDLLDRVLNVAFPGIVQEEKKDKKAEKEPVKMTTEEIKKNRPPLKNGITADEIQQYYWADELKEFAKKNKLKPSGTKKDLIKRIIAFFEGKDNTGGYKPKGKSKRRGAKKKKMTEPKKRKQEEKSDGEPKSKKQKAEPTEPTDEKKE